MSGTTVTPTPPTTVTPIVSTVFKPRKLVRVVREDGKQDSLWEIDDRYDSGWFRQASLVYPTLIDDDGDDIVLLPLAAASFTVEKPKFKECVYTATKDLVESVLGRKLHFSDSEWLSLHPSATDDGIPQSSVVSAVHEMLEPYELGVYRVRLKAGHLHGSPDVAKWTRLLGCNPFGLVDRRTTNEEAAVKLGLTEEQAQEMFRLEYHTVPLKPSIICSGGDLGGHAAYLAPRAWTNPDWQVSIQVREVYRIQYADEVVNTVYEPRAGSRKLNLYSCTRPDGSKFTYYSGYSGSTPSYPSSPAAGGSHSDGWQPGTRQKYNPQTGKWENVNPNGGGPDKADPFRTTHGVSRGTEEKGTVGKAKGGKGKKGKKRKEAKALDHDCIACIARTGSKKYKLCGRCIKDWRDAWSLYTCPNMSCQADLGRHPPYISGTSSTDHRLVTCSQCSTLFRAPMDDVMLIAFYRDVDDMAGFTERSTSALVEGEHTVEAVEKQVVPHAGSTVAGLLPPAHPKDDGELLAGMGV